MNKTEFTYKLKNALGNISPSAVEDIMYDYQEHFEVGLEQGKTEDEIAQSLGDPRVIAKQYRAEYIVQQAHKDSSGVNVLRAVFAAISLGFFNLIFMIPIYAVLVSVIVSLFAIAFSLVLTGVVCLLATILQPILPAWLSIPAINPAILLFGSISVTSFGLLFGLGTFKLTKACLRLTAGYIKTNMNIISKKERESENNV